MKTILEELYDGRILPLERIVPQSPEYRQLDQKISDLSERWREKLSTEDYQSLEALLELHCASGLLEASAAFGYGFKLGALIMLEVLGGKGELVRGGE